MADVNRFATLHPKIERTCNLPNKTTEIVADRGGPGPLNKISASLSGSSAGVKLLCGAAAVRSRLDLGCGRQGLRQVALRCRRRRSGGSLSVLRRRFH